MPLYRVHFHALTLQSQECAADSPEDAVAWAQVNLRARLDRDPKYTGELQPNAVVDLIDHNGDLIEEVGDFSVDPESPEPEPATPAVAPILITLYGGCVQDVEHIPAGVTVVIHDYDCEGEDEDLLTRDADGEDFVRSEWPIRVPQADESREPEPTEDITDQFEAASAVLPDPALTPELRPAMTYSTPHTRITDQNILAAHHAGRCLNWQIDQKDHAGDTSPLCDMRPISQDWADFSGIEETDPAYRAAFHAAYQSQAATYDERRDRDALPH